MVHAKKHFLVCNSQLSFLTTLYYLKSLVKEL